MDYTQYIGISLVDYTDDELVKIKDDLEVEYDKYISQWAKEVAYLINQKNVDPYSFWGEKKINRVIKRYANKTSDIKIIVEDIEKELEKRDNYYFEQSFIGGKKYHDDSLTEKEFFEREEMKTRKYKKNIDNE